mgnify:CR=1 FL=1
MNSFSQFESALVRLRSAVDAHCSEAGREAGSVTILPVTKRQPLEAVGYALRAGMAGVGENLVQEAAAKIQEFSGTVQWELIGHLQSNKARLAVELFDRIQTVDSVKLLRRLDRFAAELGKRQRILLQVNTSQDPAKHGVLPEAADPLVEAALGCGHVALEGLMTIGRHSSEPAIAEQTFHALRELRDRLVEQFGHPLPELSMGMSADIEAAVKAGSTLVRVGTALFGERPAKVE